MIIGIIEKGPYHSARNKGPFVFVVLYIHLTILEAQRYLRLCLLGKNFSRCLLFFCFYFFILFYLFIYFFFFFSENMVGCLYRR